MPKDSKRPLKVFLCHASGDKPQVRALYRRLVAEGVDAWLDQEKLLPGQDWRVEIPRAVREADVVVVCLSNKSITKEGYIQKEIKFALDSADEKPEGTIFLIPARLEECIVPEQVGRWQWVDLYEENGFIKLLRSLKLRADKVGAVIQQSVYEDEDIETERRLEQLYTEGLEAFYTENWDRACQRFQRILSERPNHVGASEKLEEAERQRNLANLYAQSIDAYNSENWQVAVRILEQLSQRTADYKDVAQLLRNARKQKQLKELYIEAKKLHAAKKWQAVLKVFNQISTVDPLFPDSDGLLSSAQNEVIELNRLAELNARYGQAVRKMDAGQWYEARSLLEQVHKAQTGFLETERLLKKAENEILKVEELNKRRDQINILYEQAHGLFRSKNWRKSLEKMEEIQNLDGLFEDKDDIDKKARFELEREEQEAQKQNQLAMLYTEAVRLMRAEKYQEALDKWQEVKAIDPMYPDRQLIQRTASKKIAQLTKSLQSKPRTHLTRSIWTRTIGSLIISVIIIVSAVLLGRRAVGNILPTPTSVADGIITPIPTIYDDFNDQTFDVNLNSNLWENVSVLVPSYIKQQNGELVFSLEPESNQNSISLNATKKLKTDQYILVEWKMFLSSDKWGQDGRINLSMSIIDQNGKVLSYMCAIRRLGVLTPQAWCGVYGGLQEFSSGEKIASYNIRHIFRIEIDPATKVVFYIDDVNVGEYTPSDAEELRGKDITIRLEAWSVEEHNIEGHFDDIKIGEYK